MVADLFRARVEQELEEHVDELDSSASIFTALAG